MSYTVEKLENSQVKIDFVVEKSVFDDAVKAAYQKTKHKFAIAGFRKGHVPMKVIEGIYGKEVFYEDAMDIVIPNAYSDALSHEEDLEVVAQPELSAFDFNEDGSAVFTLIATVKPEVALGSYKGLAVTKKVAKVTAKQVDEALASDQQKQARLVEVEGEAQLANTVNIDFVGSVDGVEFEGGSAEGFDLELGSGSFIPGFEDQLVGTKAGEKKDVVVTFPEDYHAENLKGKDAVFACTINSVKTKELPALDDEFAKEISEFDTLAEYKASIKERMKSDNEAKAEREYEDSIVEKIVEGATVAVPDAMVQSEAEDMFEEFAYRLQYQGMRVEDYMQYLGTDKDKMIEEYKDQASKSVKARLVMEAVVKAEDIKFEEAELDAKIADFAEKSSQTVDEFKKTLTKQHIDYMVNQILSEKLMDILKKANPVKAPAKKAKAE